MIISFLIGAGMYALAQFVWYAPFGFGPLWNRYQKDVPAKDAHPVALPAFVPPGVRGIVLPAVLISLALHVLRIMMSRSDFVGFLSGVLTLWFLVVMPKYFRKNTAAPERRKWLIEDGALLWSLLWVAESIMLWGIAG